MPQLAYLNDAFCALDQARVSVEDRGFQFADGVYEVIVFHGRKPVMLEAHLQRLVASAHGIHLNIDPEALSLRARIEEGVRRAGFENTVVYLQVTRGAAPRNHVYPANLRPTVVMTFKDKPVVPAEKRAQGYAVVTMNDFRWSRCDLKTIALLPNVIAKNEAIARGFDDAVFLGPQGDVREASSANIFIIRDGRLVTRPEDETILPGITRRLVIQSARNIDLPIEESCVTAPDLKVAQEVFLCSTTIDVMPVVRVDDRVIADGRPGPLTAKIHMQYLHEVM